MESIWFSIVVTVVGAPIDETCLISICVEVWWQLQNYLSTLVSSNEEHESWACNFWSQGETLLNSWNESYKWLRMGFFWNMYISYLEREKKIPITCFWHKWGVFPLDHRCEVVCELGTGLWSTAMRQVLLPLVNSDPFWYPSKAYLDIYLIELSICLVHDGCTHYLYFRIKYWWHMWLNNLEVFNLHLGLVFWS